MLRKLVIVVGFLMVTLIGGYYVTVQGLSYEISGYRAYHEQLDEQHLRELNSRFENAYDATEGELRRFALNNTAFELDFAMRKNGLKNPNSILDGKKGHCKMYSYLMAASFNQLAKRNGIKANCRIAIGHVFLYGVNLHQFSNSSFFANHDFCVITGKEGAQAADAILYDYFGVDHIRIRTPLLACGKP